MTDWPTSAVLALMLATYFTARRASGGASRQKFSWGELGRSFRSAWLGLLLPIIVVGGILVIWLLGFIRSQVMAVAFAAGMGAGAQQPEQPGKHAAV